MLSHATHRVRLSALRIVGIYAFIAATWILVSDNIVGWLVSDHATMTTVQVFKGWLFVLLTSLILYKLIFSDNLELAKTTAQLQDSEERFHTIYDSLNDAIFIHDAASGRILDVNETACRLYGYSHSEIVDNSLFQLGMGEPPYSEVEALAWIHRCAGGTPQTFEWITTLHDGSHLWVEVSMRHAIIGGENRVVVMVRDISDRKRAEETLNAQQAQLEELNRTLEIRVNEAIVELRQKDEILIQQSRNAAMGEMLNTIAHQWRQPLNNIAIYVQTLPLLMDSGELTDEQLQSDVESIMAIILYMSKTIDDFRTFFRHEKVKQAFHLKDVAEKALRFVSARMEHLEIVCQSMVKKEPLVFGYESEYVQVLVNILNNAIDILSHTENARRQIVLTIDELDDKAIMTVQDTGGGIAPEALPHIFEPYYTTKGPGEGSGIGLYMAKTIIEKHMSGTLSASNTGDGAVFCILVPTTDKTLTAAGLNPA